MTLQELRAMREKGQKAMDRRVGGDRSIEIIVGMGQYVILEATHTADVAFMVRDDHQNRGIGTELLRYLTYLAKRRGLLGFTASVISENEPMLHVFEKSGADIESTIDTGVLELRMTFRG